MAQTINPVIFDIIKDAYVIEKRTDEDKQDYEEELKNELFNDYLHHYVADEIKLFKYMKIFKQLYNYYKDNHDMGDTVIDAIDNKQKLFNLYALMVFDELIDGVVSDKTEDEDAEEDEEYNDENKRWVREDDDDVWG